ncbi:uncharacterized protein N7511_003389 [Penicillium nucicola]|uniref:uncharacterized protein n=1 Tax=Penicillium nucicola TaxID=1850975 RepID=UPI0025453748|nr:uncharacterized protein N7511_003389 [Penicillium nucicola]KAJ5771338.1 hypothetical protein N7511_003389 [Penicillium nucicola]
MASSGALPQTLKAITATKINELSKQRAIFDQHKEKILVTANAATDLRSRALVLLDGLARLKGLPKDSLDKNDSDLDADSDSGDDHTPEHTLRRESDSLSDHSNIRRFLLQGPYDSSISQSSLQDWIGQLEKELSFLEAKHEHGAFFSKLVTEWLSELDPTDDPKPAESDAKFEQVGRAEMHDQRAQWETLVFTPATHVREQVIKDYLDNLFKQTELSREAIKNLKARITSFANNLSSKGKWIDVPTLKWVSKALLKTDLLSNEKASVLKEFMRNKEVAQEVADVLNMRIASLDSWAWDRNGIPVEMRRQLNGKYRVFMDEDLLDALLLQYLGTTWSVEFREVFEIFLHSHAWKPLREEIPEEYKERRRYFLGTDPNKTQNKVNETRKKTYENEYFMSQLPTSVDDSARDYDEDNEGPPQEETKSKNALDTKHSLLHLLITESIIHKHQRGEFTAVRSDFEWFGPSMPHATLLTVLEYFGVPEKWLNFFKIFLQAPLKFFQDGSNATIQTRQRGLPMSHTLADCFGEAVLFCMDYAVNQSTDGSYLYRLHDDFWFWGAEKTCIKAWEAMSDFSEVMGLKFNTDKTGTVMMGKSRELDNKEECPKSILPEGDIRWGFLVLDAEKGKFTIDQAQVDEHIEELSRQLTSCKSVFAWVQAWNAYFGRFFANNFAKPAVCFGRDHIDMAISTLGRIERTLFENGVGEIDARGKTTGVTDYLRQVISDRFGVKSLPDGFFYYPPELGGLGLLNPSIKLLAMRENIKETPRKILHKAEVQHEKTYQFHKTCFEEIGPDSKAPSLVDTDGKSLPFMSLEEYNKYPDTYSAGLLCAYNLLCRVPEEEGVALTPSFEAHQGALEPKSPISNNWRSMTPYWRWVAQLYHDEMIRTYGSLAAAKREFMPLGVVKTLREGRFRWQG